MPYSIIFSSEFSKKLLKIRATKVITKVHAVTRLLGTNPQHPALRLHKLKNTEYWSVSINMTLRIKIIIENGNIYLLDLGTHDEVY